MTQPEVIATHPFFGAVMAGTRGRLHFHPSGVRADIEYWAQTGAHSPREDYELLAPRLAAFAVFCRRIDANDRLVRERFAAWPSSAGAFALIAATINAYDSERRRQTEEVRRHIPDFAIPLMGLALRYRALDQEAWDYAGITWHPPEFSAYFDEANGTFLGLDEGVERGMRGLPETVTRSRFEGAFYRHPHFGRRRLEERFLGRSISRLGAVAVGGRKVPLELYLDSRSMAAFEPEQLDPFVPLAERIISLDVMVRTKFPAKEREVWLSERYARDNYGRLRRALDKVFPGAKAGGEVSPQTFACALTLRRACFSLSPEESGGASLTLDYHLLPRRLDNYLFAAKFDADGALMEIVIES